MKYARPRKPPEYMPDGSIRVDILNGYFAVIDAADAPTVLSYPWVSISTPGRRAVYAMRRMKQRTVLMHRVILSAIESSLHVDHIDGDGLNNRRSNLRLATRSQNLANRHGRKPPLNLAQIADRVSTAAGSRCTISIRSAKYVGVYRTVSLWEVRNGDRSVGVATNRRGPQWGTRQIDARGSQLKRMVESHATLTEIGDQFGLTRERIRQLMVAYGIERNHVRRKPATADDREHRWYAECLHVSVGPFASEAEAALAYNEMAIANWGEFATPNVIVDGQEDSAVA